MIFVGNNTKLKAVRIMDVCLIPRHLVDQIKLRDWPTERFYTLSGAIAGAGLVYAWVDEKSLVRGFLWANVSPLDMNLHVHLMSVDKEYQGKGVLKDGVDLCRAIATALKLNGIVAWTRGVNAFRKLGFTPTGEQKCVMEVK